MLHQTAPDVFLRLTRVSRSNGLMITVINDSAGNRKHSFADSAAMLLFNFWPLHAILRAARSQQQQQRARAAGCSDLSL